MGSTVSATIRINDAFSGPLNKLSAGLNRSASTMSKLSDRASGTGSMFKSVLGGTVIGNGLTKGIGLIGTGLKSMYSELDESSRAWQTFNGNMAMIGQGPKQIASTRGDLQKFAQQTIYSASDMASTYSQLAAVGTKNTTALVKGFGGLAAASSDPQQAMKTLSQQATQAAAKPKIQWMDFKLMLEQTPAGMAAVAKTMHKSTGQLVKDVQAGKVKTQDFFDAIAKTGTNKNFSKMATQYKTIGQAMDGLRETLANKMQPAFDKVSKVGIKAISGFTDKLGSVNFNGMANKIVPVVQTIVNVMKTAGQAIGAMFSSMGKSGAFTAIESTLSSIGKAFGNVFSKLASGGGKDPFAAFKSIGSIAGSAISGAAKGIGALADVIGKLDPGSIKLIAAAFVALKMSTRGLVITAVVAGLTMLSKLNPSTLNALAKGIGLLAFSFMALKAIKNVDGILSGIGNSLSNLKGGALTKVSASATQAATGFIKLGASLLLVGAGVALAGAGMWLLAGATTQLVSAGWPAVALFFGMILAIGLLAVAVGALGPALLAGSVGFVIFGAALALIGASVLMAGAGLALLATQLPVIAASGAGAAGALILLGAAMAVFGVLSLVASVGLLMLGVTLAVLGVGFAVAAVGALLFGAAMMLVAAGSFIAFAGLILVFTGSMMAMMGLMLVMAGGMMAMMGLMMVMMGAMMAFMGLILVMTGGLMAMVGLMMVMVGGTLAMVGLMMVMVGAMMAVVGLTMIMAVSMIAAAGLTLVGTMAMAASVGMMALAGATAMVASQVAAIASSAASAAASLTGMVAAVSVVKAGLSTLGSAARSAVSAFISALRGGAGDAAGAGRALANAATNGMKSGVGAARSAGAMIGAGLAAGLRSQVGAVAAAANALVAQANRAARAAAKIHSPSKLFAEIGDYMGQGMAIGMNNTQSLIASAGRTMAHTAMDSATIGTNPGDMLADGFNRAYDAVTGVVSAMRGVTGKTIGVNGQMNTTNGTVPSTTSFDSGVTPYSTVNDYTTTTDTASTGNSVTIAPGAIQINSTGKGYEDAEVLVSRIEDYLMNVDERRG